MSNSIAPGSSADVNVKVTALTTNPNVPVTYKTIILKKNLVNGVNTLTQAMLNQSNVKYVVKYDFILDPDAVGGTILMPQGCILEFNGGSLANAQGSSISFVGNNTLLIGVNCINNIHFSGTFNNSIISSNVFIGNCYIKDLITLIKDGGTINIFNLIKHDGVLFTINKSFTINGNGNTLLIPVEQNICSDFLFDVNNTDSIIINDLTIDGQVSETAYADGNRIHKGYPIEHNYKWLTMITDCNNVIIKNCKFKNLWYQNAGNPEYPIENVTNNEINENFAHYGFIGIIRCKNTILENNLFKNIYSEEGIVTVGEVDDNSSNTVVKNTDIIILKNNKFICRSAFNTTSNLFEPIDSNLSNWVNIIYKRCVVENNIFGCSGGSQINAFCYDSNISNNRFEASRSGAIDLDESSHTKFVPKNIIIKNNISLGCTIFFQFAGGENISIEDNVLDNTGIPTGYGDENLAFIHHSRNESIVPISEHLPLRSIYVINNICKGSLFFIRDDNWATIKGDKEHYLIENNHIESRTTYYYINDDAHIRETRISSRPVIQLSCFNNIIIRNNYMVNSGRPECWGNNSIAVTSRNEVFIEFGVCWHPNSYLHNIKIEGNTYVTDNYNLFISTAINNSGIIGDRLYYIPSIKHINIENNRHIGTNRTDAWVLSNETNLDNDNTFLNNSCNYLKSNILFKKDFPKAFTQLPHPRYDTQGIQVDKGIKYYTYNDNNLVEFLQRCYPSIVERYDKLGAYIQVNGVICLVIVTGEPDGNITIYTDNGNLKKDGTLVYYEIENNPGLNKLIYNTLIDNS